MKKMFGSLLIVLTLGGSAYAASTGLRYHHNVQYLNGGPAPKAYDASSVLDPLGPPTDADLEETIDIGFTPEFTILANALGPDPVDLYNFVHDYIEFDNYFGSLKGAHGCLMESSGNDMDQASLLIALLRYHGIPARYQFGTLRLSWEQAQDLLGMDFEIETGEEKYNIVGQAFSSLGFPAASILGNNPGEPSDPLYLHIDFTWVRAYVPVTNYRGRSGVESQNDWVFLLPALKRHTLSEAPFPADAVPFAATEFVEEASLGELPTNYFAQKVVDEVNKQGEACPSLSALMPEKEIIREQWEVLPVTLPAQLIIDTRNGVAAPATWTEIPSSFRHQLRIVSEYEFFEGFPETDMSATLNCPEIYGKVVAVEWPGAGKADQATLDAAGAGLPAGVKANVSGRLIVDGNVIRSGDAHALGTSLTLLVYQRIPNFANFGVPAPGRRTASIRELENEYTGFHAGGATALGLAINEVTNDTIAKLAEDLTDMRTSGASASRIRTQELAIMAHQYLREYLAGSRIAAGLHHSHFFRSWSVIQGVDLLTEPDPIFGGGGFPAGTRLDFTSTVSPHPVDGDEKNTAKVIELSGWVGSTLEAIIIEKFENQASVSTATILQRALNEGQQIYYFDKNNVGDVAALLQLSGDVVSKIQNHINNNQGPEYDPFALAHQRTITVNRWSGAGYLLGNAFDGTGSYLINGGWD